MESLIHTINKLQDVFAVIGEHKIDLPQIVVVGSQSSGKSSVIESLVGKSFLPRGTGIVTRAPLILQMIRYTRNERESMLGLTKNDRIKEWACFLHQPERVYHDFGEVRAEIAARTDFLAGTNKGITHEPIVLKVYTALYSLTFVDLPGMTKIAVGDQPEDIDEQIQELVMRYAQQPNSIILAVVTANTDPSTSESLKIAKRVDPEGARTVAAVTKLDLIDKGTVRDAAELLCGRKIPVRLGIVGVVNRSQKDIDDNKSVSDALRSEREFLRAHYPDIHQRHGSQMLADALQDILLAHIRRTCPALREQLRGAKARLEDQLRTLRTPDEKVSFVLGLLKDVCRSYGDTLTGDRRDVAADAVVGGAKISRIVHQEYVDLLNAIDPLQDLADETIGNILLNSAGTDQSSFVNEKALESMIGRQLENLVEPSMVCVDRVSVEMLQIFDTIDKRHLDTLKRFPRLNTDIRKVLHNMVEDSLKNIKEFIKSYIETYQASLNTTNPDFISELCKLSNVIQDMFELTTMTNKKGLSNDEFVKAEKERTKQLFKQILSGLSDLDHTLETSKLVRLHRNLTRCYFEFVRKNVRDFVPKRIIHKLVKYVVKNIDHFMHEFVFTPYIVNRSMDQVLMEVEGVVEDRNRAVQMLNAVNKALNNMTEVQFI